VNHYDRRAAAIDGLLGVELSAVTLKTCIDQANIEGCFKQVKNTAKIEKREDGEIAPSSRVSFVPC
jgi:hypothetical protein